MYRRHDIDVKLRQHVTEKRGKNLIYRTLIKLLRVQRNLVRSCLFAPQLLKNVENLKKRLNNFWMHLQNGFEIPYRN